MTLSDILNKKIAIIGLGKENLQFLTWLLEVVRFNPKQIILADQKDIDLSEILRNDSTEAITIFSGENYLDCLQIPDLEYVFKAPGIWSLRSEFEAFRQQKGADRICSSLVFFFQKYREQIVGVTGTKGKSTTSALIHHLLNSFEPTKANYCGNTTGISPYQFWTDLSQEIDPNQFFVIELSSFQLQDLGFSQISSKYAVVTNYFLDHQDQHATAGEYWKAKDEIFKSQKDGDIIVITQTVLNNTQSADLLKTPKTILVDSESQKQHLELSNFIKSPLLGLHNQLNTDQAVIITAAIRLKSMGQIGDINDICEEIKKNKFKYQSSTNRFKGLAHRIELVRTVESQTFLNQRPVQIQINFYDDGYATEPEAVASAIEALTQKNNEFLWLQIAGKDKGGVLENLVSMILRKEIDSQLFRVDYCGAVGQRVLNTIYQALGTSQNVPLEIFKDTFNNSLQSLDQIQKHFSNWLQELLDNYQQIGEFNKIHELLTKPKIILNIALSPVGSSFDEFKNATERSKWWVERVQGLE
jgi:UDP-N-acetylmuramoylalanine-D-glutamate ligase